MASPSTLLRFLLLCTFLMVSKSDNLTTNGAPGIVEMEAEELLGLFEVMGALLEDPNWTQMHPHPCTDTPWPGIQCEADLEEQQQNPPILHVTKLHVGPDVSNPICKTSAKLSESLLKLPYLKTLSIFSCFLTSRVILSPSLFGSFSSLEQLVIKSNPGLFGKIPPTLAEIATLRVLSLSQNSLHGGFPKELGGLGILKQLDFSYNNLTGEIPKEIGGLTSLTILDLSYNGFQGQVPSSLGQLVVLQKIDLSSNRIVGRIPPDIGKLKRLVLLDFSHNSLKGPIPDTLSGLKGLEYFLIENNPINTRLPLFLGALENLTVLSLSGCGFFGPIPTSFCSLDHLIALSLDRNHLHGPVPPKLGALTHLDQLNLSQNQLSGELFFSYDFVQRLGKRLDVRGNKGLCTSHQLNKKLPLYLDVPECKESAISSNSNYHEKSKPYWVEGQETSNAADVIEKLKFLWCLLFNLLVILIIDFL
ncbi:hypothetical protein HHK36_013331 [Tetracentron sinense]|uniref:Piriformospora indica-insensitive protein 2 n=1 Tax=Tetracentron sinense TaxID=13715 RepID=A0A835DGH1_TETSI|nr:hypothetical protein HHK36_013331 [Tetracentron sinense]